MEAKITPKLEISFILRDKDGNIKEQGTELTEITEITEIINKEEVIKNGNPNE